jgi:hypothetical protein
MREVRLGSPPRVRTGSEGHRAHHAWHQIKMRMVAERLGSPSAARSCPTLPSSSESYRAVTAIVGNRVCPGTNGDCRGVWALGDSANLLQNPISAQRYLTTTPLCPRRHFSMALATTSLVGGLRRSGGAAHWTALALDLRPLSPPVIIACARSSSPNLFPVSPPCGRQAGSSRGGHEPATACATSPGDQGPLPPPFPQLSGYCPGGLLRAATACWSRCARRLVLPCLLSAARSATLPPAALTASTLPPSPSGGIYVSILGPFPASRALSELDSILDVETEPRCLPTGRHHYKFARWTLLVWPTVPPGYQLPPPPKDTSR